MQPNGSLNFSQDINTAPSCYDSFNVYNDTAEVRDYLLWYKRGG
jgi:hypothetical protein